MMDESHYKNKTVLVTGGSRGIGRAIALHFAKLGANVILTFVRNESRAQETAAEIQELGVEVDVHQANLSKLDHINRLFEQIQAKHDNLDFFISNAASGFNRPALQQREDGWDYTMNTNARSFLFASQKVVPLMEAAGKGCIVAITSPGSHRVIPDYVSVGASKAALESLTRYLAVELAPRHIRVNAVSPGIVETDALKHFAILQNPEVITRAVENTPAGRLVTLQDVANVVAFLCSPEAEMICGQVIIVDGGYTLIMPG